ncbi:MAG: hypothetical protein AAF235_03720 [Planctomycetota bacterium]
MSPVDLSTLQRTANAAVIAGDKPCPKCEYNLRGLAFGGNCPECGTPIRRSVKRRFADNLTDAPMWYLRTLAIGFGIAASGLVVATLWSGINAFRSFQGVPAAPSLTAGVYLVCFAGWIAGVVIAKTARPLTDITVRDDILDNKKIRLAARALQSLTLGAIAFAWGGAVFASPILGGISSLLVVASLFGLVPLCVYFSSLADWAGESGIGSRFRTAAWCLSVCGSTAVVTGLLIAIPGVPAKLLITIVFVLAFGLTLVGIFALFASVLQLAMTCFWAMQNAVVAQERAIRLEEKRAREDAERQRKQAASDAAHAEARATQEAARAQLEHTLELDQQIDDAIPLAGDLPQVEGRRSDETGPRYSGAHIIERQTADDDATYEIEPDDDTHPRETP